MDEHGKCASGGNRDRARLSDGMVRKVGRLCVGLVRQLSSRRPIT